MPTIVLNPPRQQYPFLRVGFATPLMQHGGAERWLLSLARHIRTLKIGGIAIESADNHPSACQEAARLAPLFGVNGTPYAQQYSSADQAMQLLIENSDVIVTWGITDTARYFGQCGKPVVHVSHGDGVIKYARADCEKAVQGATNLVAIGKACISAFPEQLQRQVTVIHNGIEVDRVTPRRGRKRIREEQGLTDDHKVILYLGRYQKLKNVKKLLQAMPLLPEEWRIVLCGAGKDEMEVDEEASIYATGRAHMFPLMTHVGDLLAMADVLVLPSVTEGFPLVVMESWMAGLPTVVTPLAYTREIQEMHGDLCYLLPSNQPSSEDIAAAVKAAVEAGRSAPMLAKARAVAWEYYSAAAMAYRWEQYLSWAIANWQELQLATPAISRSRPRTGLDGLT